MQKIYNSYYHQISGSSHIGTNSVGAMGVIAHTAKVLWGDVIILAATDV